MVTIAILVFGGIGYLRLPVALFPPLSYPTLTVRTDYPGASPRTVEAFLTRPIEDALGVVSGLVSLHSISRPGTSDVVLEFEWGTNIDRRVPEIREKIQSLTLPEEVQAPLILRYDPSFEPMMEIGLSATSPSTSMERIRLYAQEQIARPLTALPGVPNTRVLGGRIQEIRVEVDEEKSAALGLSVRQVAERISASNINQPGGTLEEGDATRLVRTMSELQSLKDIEQVVIDRRGDSPVHLSRIATVSMGSRDQEVLTRIQGRPAVLLQVFKEADANLVEVAHRVRKTLLGSSEQQAFVRAHPEKHAPGSIRSSRERRLRNFLAHQLPDDLQIEILSDRSEFIRASVSEVILTALIGGILAVIVLFFFLENLSSTLIVGTSIPVSILATFAAMHLGEVSINIMSLGGLALGIGMLVDNAIVVLESIHRCREEGDAPHQAAVRGSSEVATAVIASTLTTICVFFPLVFVEGVAGQIFHDQALTVVYALVASLFVALFLIPTLSALRPPDKTSVLSSSPSPIRLSSWSDFAQSVRAPKTWVFWLLFPYGILRFLLHCLCEIPLRLLQHTTERIVLPIFRFFLRGSSRGLQTLVTPALKGFRRSSDAVASLYHKALIYALKKPGALLGLLAVLVALTATLSRSLGTELIPPMKQGEFSLELSLEPGTSLDDTARILLPLEKSLSEDSRVQLTYSRIGVEADDLEAAEKGPHSARITLLLAPGSFRETEISILSDLRTRIARIPEIEEIRVTRPTLLSLRDPIAVEVYSENLDTLAKTVPRLKEILSSISGLTDVKSSLSQGSPELAVIYDRDLLSRYDLTVDDVARTLRRKIQGEVPSRLRVGERQLDIRVRAARGNNGQGLQLERIRIGGPGQGKVLSELGQIVQESSHNEIRRIRHRRAAILTAGVEGLDLGRMADQVRDTLKGRFPEVEIEVGGQNREIARSRSSLSFALALAIFLVYVVMASQFESFFHPLVILATLPLAGMGVILILALLGISFSILVGIGTIVLAGVVVNNAIVLIDTVSQLRSQGLERSEALQRAASIRFRPIMMTTATTVLGLLPLTGQLPLPLGLGEGLELRAPLALTVMAGLITATGLTLIVIPVVYQTLEEIMNRFRRPSTPDRS
jgi:HAE1 family hydrophobic/amphiphilic exporter-1